VISPGPRTAQQLAQRSIALKRAESGDGASASIVAGLSAEALYKALSQWVGIDGCHALFARALADALREHPLLGALQLRPRAKTYLDGVAAAVSKYGETATADAIEATLTGTIELLGRLIGADMAANLIERGLLEPSRDSAKPENRRAEA
jgi:hypothetical protein